jgi:RES domain-containing protein
VIKLYRLSKSEYADELSGEGARKYGGRWNSKGLEIIYASESRSLALNEALAGIGHTKFLHQLYSVLVITFSNEASKLEIHPEELPKNWNISPSPSALKTIGDNWIKNRKSLLLRMPSAAVIGEFNFLINPNHFEFKKIQWSVETFPFDKRIFK